MNAQSAKKILVIIILTISYTLHSAPGWFTDLFATAPEEPLIKLGVGADKETRETVIQFGKDNVTTSQNLKDTAAILTDNDLNGTLTFVFDKASVAHVLKVCTICGAGLCLSMASVALIKRELKKNSLPQDQSMKITRARKLWRAVSNNYTLGTLGFLGGLAIILHSNSIVLLIS